MVSARIGAIFRLSSGYADHDAQTLCLACRAILTRARAGAQTILIVYELDPTLLEQLWKLRMVLELACVEHDQFIECPVEHCEAVIAGEARSVDNAIDVRMLGVDSPAQRLASGEMTCPRCVRWRANIHAARISQIEQEQFRIRLRGNLRVGPYQNGSQRKRAPGTADKSIANEGFGDASLECERRIQHGVPGRAITKSRG
jgi:hypothetical protein